MNIIEAILDTRHQNSVIGNVTQFDNATLELQVVTDGVIDEAWDDPQFELIAMKRDMNPVREVDQNKFTILSKEEHRVQIELKEQFLTCRGTVKMQLIVKDGSRLSTTLFYLVIGQSLDHDIVESHRDVKVLDDLEAYVKQGFDDLAYQEQRMVAVEQSTNDLNETMNANEAERNKAEIIRQETFDINETHRARTFNNQIEEQSRAFSNAQDQREKDFSESQQNMSQDFETSQRERESAFKESQKSNQNTFSDNEEKRQKGFETAEFERQKNENNRLLEEERRRVKFDEMVQSTQGAIEKAEELIPRQENLEKTFEELIIDAGSSNSEIVSARVDNYTGEVHKTIGGRLDRTSAQLSSKASQSELNTMSSRLDNIVANSGNTDGNTELIDARVGADGTIHSNVGHNIRSVANGCVEKGVFTSCFRNVNPSYKTEKEELYGNKTFYLKSFIKDVTVKNCPEDIVLGVGMVLKTETRSTIAIFKCVNGIPLAEYTFAFTPQLINDKQILTSNLEMDGNVVTVEITVENWEALEYHEKRSIPYSIGGLSAKCYSNFVHNNDFDKQISIVNSNLDIVLADGYVKRSIFTSCFALDKPVYVSNQNESVNLNDYIVDLQIEGLKDDVSKCCIGRVTKGSSSVSDLIGLYWCNSGGSPDGSAGQGVIINPKNTNEEQLIVATGKLGEFSCTVRMIVKNWSEMPNQDTKSIHSRYTLISPKSYIKSRFDLVTNGELQSVRDEINLQIKPKKFKNHDLLEQLFVDLQLIGFDETDRISVGMVRKNYTNGGTRPVMNIIGIYGLDENDRADASQMIFGINFTAEEAEETRVRKIVRSTFNGKNVEIRTTINWALIQGDDYAMPALGAFNVSGINSDFYINDYTDMIINIEETGKGVENCVILNTKPNNDFPIISFVDDDGNAKFLTKSKPIYDKHGVKCTVAVVTDFVLNNNGLSLSDIKGLNSEGYEIVSHTNSHSQEIYKPGVATATDEEIELDIKKSFDYLKENGLETDTIVWAWGGFKDATRYTKLAKKYFKYGINATGGVMKAEILNDMYYSRYFINMNSNTLDKYKTLIDDCYANNGWLIFGTHSGSDSEFDSEFLDEIVNYVKSKKIQIMTVKEANKIKGNICSLGTYGEKGNSLYIGRNGVVLN